MSDDTVDERSHLIHYHVTIDFPKDKISVGFNGDSVEFPLMEGIVRHRHLRLIENVQQVFRDYIRDNK